MVETERAIFVSLEVTPRWLHCAIPQAPLFPVVCPTICQTDSHSYLWNETKWTRIVKIYIVYKMIICFRVSHCAIVSIDPLIYTFNLRIEYIYIYFIR